MLSSSFLVPPSSESEFVQSEAWNRSLYSQSYGTLSSFRDFNLDDDHHHPGHHHIRGGSAGVNNAAKLAMINNHNAATAAAASSSPNGGGGGGGYAGSGVALNAASASGAAVVATPLHARVNGVVPVDDIADHVRRMKRQTESFETEFRLLPTGQVAPWDVASKAVSFFFSF